MGREQTHGARRGGRAPLLACAALILLAALAGASAFAWRAAALSRASAAGVPLAQLNAESARANPAAGCAGAPPAAQPNVVYTGTSPDHVTPAPREVALTFDDGPTPATTEPILDVLERTHTPATFFVVGHFVQSYPDLVRRERRDGFAIGLHTWDHPVMTALPVDQMRQQLSTTFRALDRALGPLACLWLWRAPYGAFNAQVLQVAASYGLTTIQWNDVGLDWERPGAWAIANNVLASAAPGAIVLLHDGPALREQTAAALPLILDGLRARGLTPVTVPRLLADAHFPGVVLRGGVAAPVPSVPTRPTPPTRARGDPEPAPTPAPTDTPVALPPYEP
ncbi:MAG TPA: polysaccharide deacetylase family protein [Ktedonobacterales bacterium]